MDAAFAFDVLTTAALDEPCDACVVGLYDGEPVAAVLEVWDHALEQSLSKIASSSKEISGESGRATIVHTLGKLAPRRICIVGLGKRPASPHSLRKAAGSSMRRLGELGLSDICTTLHLDSGLQPAVAARTVAEGFAIGGYRAAPKRKEERPRDLIRVRFANEVHVEEAIRAGYCVSDGVNLARRLVFEPANLLTPTGMANIAQSVAASSGLEVAVLDETDMESLGMGLILAVSRGSDQPARLIILNHRAVTGSPIELALIGKGITFDTGGISLKKADGMGAMKGDMGGAAAVIGAMKAIADLKIPLNVMGVIPAAENMPDGGAYRPGDVIMGMDGTTVEIITTDAEGRLVLGDALAYARKLGARRIVDAATLTGAVSVALGPQASGAMTNSPELLDLVRTAGDESGERIWELPMWDEYDALIKSDIADMTNAAPPSGGSRSAGAIAGAKFLERFVGDIPWVHVDIAATSSSQDGQGWMQKGATGNPVRTFVRLAEMLAAKGPG